MLVTSTNMIFIFLILSIGGFLSPVHSVQSHPKSYNYPTKHWIFCVLEGVSKEEWDPFLWISDCGPNWTCEPTFTERLPTIGKYLG